MEKIIAPIEGNILPIFFGRCGMKAGIWRAETTQATRSKKFWHPF